jgi:site-specific DNA recombinase
VFAQLAELYRDGSLVRQAIERAATTQSADRAALEGRRTALAREIRHAEAAVDRYYRAFESGELDAACFSERVSALYARLQALRDQDGQLAHDLAARAPTAPDRAELAALADQLEDLIATGDPDQAKALLRLLIAELRVNGRDEILPTYRVPDAVVCAQRTSVELAGLEPATSWVRSKVVVCLSSACLQGFAIGA